MNNPILPTPILRSLPDAIEAAPGTEVSRLPVQRVVPVRAPSATRIQINPAKIEVNHQQLTIIPANPNRTSITIRSLGGTTCWVGGGQGQRPNANSSSGIQLRGAEALTLETTDEISIIADSAPSTNISYIEMIGAVPQS